MTLARAYTLGMTRSSIRRIMPALLAGAWLALTAEAADMLTLTSSAFRHQSPMDARFTCQGGDTSPPLSWSGAPAGTRSFALILDDPDAPGGTWVHWVLYDIPAAVTALPEGGAKKLPAGAHEGTNSWDKTGYGGPCPPSGRHRYVHKLYALDAVLPDLHAPDAAALEAAMHGHVLAEAELVGTYQKK